MRYRIRGGLPAIRIAAHVAAVADGKLMLLKSVDLPEGLYWADAAARGFVDEAFAGDCCRLGLQRDWVNLTARDSPQR